MDRRDLRDRRGVAALATVVALVAVGLLGAIVVLPLYENAVTQRRIEQTVEYLVSLTDTDKRGMWKFVFDLHGQPPGQMLHLSSQIDGSSLGACGTTYDDAAEWEPQADRVFLATGVPTPIGTINNALVRVGNEVMVEIANVRLADAERMDVMVDDPAGAGAMAGRVRWVMSDAEQELVSLRWVTPFTC